MLSDERTNDLLVTSNKTIKNLIQEITKTHSPQSFNINTAIGFNIQIDIIEERAPNVIGVINGTDSSQVV
jgi:hypothetical protein